ncbi:MAG: DUF6502 family protein [Candidatus Thiodiazotropha sp.]|jgi:hypothetical protein
MNKKTDHSESMLLRATRRVLRSLVRLFIAQGLSFTQLVELMKETYVKEIARNLVKSGERCTYSRISVVSGVHRKDVKRLMEKEEGESNSTRKLSLNARLFSIWCGDPEYLDSHGQPRPLPRTSEMDAEVSFSTLISGVISDVRPRAILDEWLSRGFVSLDETGLVRLNEDAIYPNKDNEEKLHHFARNTGDHIAACNFNLNRNKNASSLPERSVFFGGLSTKSVDQLQNSASDWARRSLLAINAEALELAKRDDSEQLSEERFTYGIYFYRELKDENDD